MYCMYEYMCMRYHCLLTSVLSFVSKTSSATGVGAAAPSEPARSCKNPLGEATAAVSLSAAGRAVPTGNTCTGAEVLGVEVKNTARCERCAAAFTIGTFSSRLYIRVQENFFFNFISIP